MLILRKLLPGSEGKAVEIIGETGDLFVDAGGVAFGGIELIRRQQLPQKGSKLVHLALRDPQSFRKDICCHRERSLPGPGVRFNLQSRRQGGKSDPRKLGIQFFTVEPV